MKKLFLIPLLLFALTVQAQLTNRYTFTKETGTFWEITMYPDITITNHTVADDEVLPAKIKIPFPFRYNGVLYDSVGISENGFIWFGEATAKEMEGISKPISAVHSGRVKGIVSALGTDLHPHVNTSLTTTIKSGVTGTAPMEELVIEWKNTSRFDAIVAGEDTLTFQIKLYHFANRVEIGYGNILLNPAVTSNVEVGLRGATNTDFFNRMTDAAHGWKNSLQGNNIASTCELKKGKQPEIADMYAWQDFSQPTGVEEAAESNIKVYPIPAGNALFIESGYTNASVIIYDMTGKSFLQQTLNERNTELNTEELANGFYIYKIVSQGSEVLHTGRFNVSR